MGVKRTGVNTDRVLDVPQLIDAEWYTLNGKTQISQHLESAPDHKHPAIALDRVMCSIKAFPDQVLSIILDVFLNLFIPYASFERTSSSGTDPVLAAVPELVISDPELGFCLKRLGMPRNELDLDRITTLMKPPRGTTNAANPIPPHSRLSRDELRLNFLQFLSLLKLPAMVARRAMVRVSGAVQDNIVEYFPQLYKYSGPIQAGPVSEQHRKFDIAMSVQFPGPVFSSRMTLVLNQGVAQPVFCEIGFGVRAATNFNQQILDFDELHENEYYFQYRLGVGPGRSSDTGVVKRFALENMSFEKKGVHPDHGSIMEARYLQNEVVLHLACPGGLLQHWLEKVAECRNKMQAKMDTADLLEIASLTVAERTSGGGGPAGVDKAPGGDSAGEAAIRGGVEKPVAQNLIRNSKILRYSMTGSDDMTFEARMDRDTTQQFGGIDVELLPGAGEGGKTNDATKGRSGAGWTPEGGGRSARFCPATRRQKIRTSILSI